MELCYLDEVVNPNNYISKVPSDKCLLGPGTCENCSTSFIDADIGNGCLLVNDDYFLNSYGTTCYSYGCTKTVILDCDEIYTFFSFDFSINN